MLQNRKREQGSRETQKVLDKAADTDPPPCEKPAPAKIRAKTP